MAKGSGPLVMGTAARELLLDFLLVDAPVGVFVLDAELRYTFVNDFYAGLSGRVAAAHVGRRLDELRPEALSDLDEDLGRVLATGEPVRDLAAEIVAAPDRTFRISVHRLAAGEGLLGLVLERSDPARAMDALQDSERRYRSLTEATTSSVWRLQPSDGSHAHWLQTIHAEDREQISEEWVACLTEGRIFDVEVRVLLGDAVRHVQVRAVPIVEDGIVLEWIGASTDITEAKTAEDAMRDAAARLRLAVDSGRMGAWDWDLATDGLTWSEETARIYGTTLQEFGGDWASFAQHVHPEDIDAIQEQVARIAPGLGMFEHEMRAWRDGGWNGHVLARGQVVPDSRGRPSRLVGMVVDVTEQHREAERLVQVLESIADAFFALDRQWRFTYVNAEAETVLGRPREELLGRVIWDEFSESVGSAFETAYRRVLDEGEVVTFEAEYTGLGWFDVRAYPSTEGVSVYFRNIDERRRTELERRRLEQLRQAASDRTARLADVASALAEAMTERDVTEVVLQHAIKAVGALGGLVALLEEDGLTLRFGAVQYPPNERAVVLGSDLQVDRPTSRAARTGEAQYLRSRQELAERFPVSSEIVAELGDEATCAVPLQVHGRPLGALTLTFAEPNPFSEEDRRLLAALAATCAQALERAQLFEREHRVAETLQRALLPEELAGDGAVRSAARYLPGTEGLDVGGDWYDLFDLSDGRLGIVLGDVVGKGVGAAAVMGGLRNALRAFATSLDGPDQVLASLDDFAHRFGTDAMATVAYGVLDIGTGELRYSSAGHLPPLFVAADGTSGYLPREPDLPIGVAPDVARHEHRVRLPAGARLVLYSDGLVESKARSLDEGMAGLAVAGKATAGEDDLDLVCSQILRDLVGLVGGDDDVALLVLEWAGPESSERCSVVLPSVVASARRARALLAEELDRWGESGLADTGTLCISEVVTNAVVHAGTPVKVDIVLHPTRVRVEVADGGAAPPERIEADDDAVHGRGVAIVEMLSADWGVDIRDDGKCVWFELERETPQA